MKQRPRIYYSDKQKALMWDRWEKGDSLHAIARLFDRGHASVQRILAETGGIRPLPRSRSKLSLTLAEREEISRGLVAGHSIRSIAVPLERAASTVSREINRNSGRRRYRANKADQAVSFILEWNGMTLAFSGDTLPNKWWIEETKGVDFVIHECFLTPGLAIEKWKFSPEEAMNALTKIHATAVLFGKVMAMTKPKHAVAYHFQNDADTLPGVMDAVQQVYDGPVDYAQDFMVWNITKDGVRTRMAVPNHESYPTPPLAEKVVDRSNPYKQPVWIAEGWPEEVTPIVEKLYEDANKEYGTNLKYK